MQMLREDLDAEIANALAAYDDEIRAAWNRIRIEPERWLCPAGPHQPEGFWVVALDDDQALFFNDIEEGFNWSRYRTRGTLDEYGCNQDSFTELLERMARAQGEARRAQLRESDVPAVLRTAGTITFRQSTYWDVLAATGDAYRIHFRDKAEFVFADPAYETIEIRSVHPLLVKYDEPSRSLYFSGAPSRPTELSHELEAAVRNASESWRGLEDCGTSIAGIERSLRSGHGMLMTAPESLATIAASVLEAAGVQCSIFGNAPARPGKRVLLLGRSYVVAGGFAFERLGAS